MLAFFRSIDRSVLLVLLLALLVVPTRSAFIASAHSESIDDEYHLVRGVRFLTGSLGRTPLNDPVLGSAVMAVPVWLEGATPSTGKDSHKFGLILHGQRVSPETLQMLVALWKSLLYVPFVAFVFCWARRIYDARAAWAAAVLLLLEPTISAHVSPAALDILGFEMIAIACWCWWRYFDAPNWPRLVAASVLSSAAMLTKHTAVIVPMAAAIYFVAFAWRTRRDRPWRRDAVHAVAAVAIALAALYVLSIDLSRFPASYYPRTLAEAMHHGEGGHPSWLLGQRNDAGSWAYYFVCAAYKVPLPIVAWLGVGLLSLAFVRPRFEELALLVPMALLAGLVIAGGINIGFRHVIPAYGLLLVLSCRWLLIDRRAMRGVAVALLGVLAVDVARYGPDQISYLNFPRHRPWLAINDSNLDWGQGLKQIRTWIDDNPKLIDGRPVWVRPFGLSYSTNIEYYLGGRATRIRRTGPAPTSGLLIVSPAHLVGLFEDDPDRFRFLRDRDPIATIGHGGNLVFDLDATSTAATRRRRGEK